MPSVTQRKTPGVYVTELDAFPPSIIGVQTAVPAFFGYTERASLSNKTVFKTPVKIGSMADYIQIFGEGFEGIYDLEAATGTDHDVKFGAVPFNLKQTKATKFYLYNSLRLFYNNGGGACYIVSLGNYESTPTYADFEAGLNVIKDQVGPTMLVAPDALLLDVAKFGDLSQAMLDQCAVLKDRMAILDIHGIEAAGQAAEPNKKLDELVEVFRGQVTRAMNYGAAYAPALATTVVGVDEITYENFNLDDGAQLTLLKASLDSEADLLYPPGSRRDQVKALIAKIAPRETGLDPVEAAKAAADAAALNKDLSASLPVLPQAYTIIAQRLGVLPPSGGMAGIYTFTDRTRGVWNAPANISLSSVLRPTVKITSEQQENLNVPVNGKAIDAIREFVGKGTVVWGARTLDGNSNDWRYIQVRRAIIYIEQSIKSALDTFVFAPNDGKTWVAVVSSISNFLQGVWNQGGLMGATANEAFTVQCGLGSTMTPLDVLEGYMVVQITLTMLRPAEFIELTFKQQMLGA